MSPRPKVETPLPLSPALRRFLYVTAATTGGVIMIVEILGAKLLAPYLGTSHFVWTAQIAVTLVALAAGYYLGGRWVDRTPKLDRLFGCILAAAVYLSVTVWVVEPVAYWCLQFRLAWGALLASTFLYFVPLMLLAMVGPFFVRMLTESVGGVGGNMGRLTAVSTLGSFAGTILIGYVLLPYLSNTASMCLAAGLLVVLAVGYFLMYQRKALPAVLLVAALAAVCGVAGVNNRTDYRRVRETYRGNSNFGMLQVMEDRRSGYRYYLNDFLLQNSYDPATKKSLSAFTYLLGGLAQGYTPKIQRALCIGLGVGIVPMELARAGVTVDVVEINPAVVPVAEQYFDFDRHRVNLFDGDGRYFLKHCRHRYDTILLDAFLGDSVPSHLMTRETFSEIRQLLNPGGTLVINSFGSLDAGQEFQPASLERTLRAVFRSVRIHCDRSETGAANIFFVAGDQPELQMTTPPDLAAVHPRVRDQVRALVTGTLPSIPGHGRVLRDNFNPADFHDAAVREELRRRMALSFQSL